jgi:D-galactarolactone isomerase
MHVYGPKDEYPVAPTTPFPVPDKGVSAYRRVMARLGIERVVVVQPTAYGDDNRCLLDAMDELGPIARGVAVVNSDVSDAELQRMSDLGVRGLRFHLLPGGVLPFEILATMADRVHGFGWHIQLQMDGRNLQQHSEVLKRLPCALVVDHTGKFLEPVNMDHPGYRALLDLLDSGRVWVKLSAPYETSRLGPPHYMDVGRLARGLIQAAPERMLWASNWPHPSALDDPPDEAMLMDLLRYWTEDDALTARILSTNPGALYGF